MVLPRVSEVRTPSGPARLHVAGPDGAPVLALGHGAGGGVDSPDLLAVRDAGLAAGMQVVRVEQPWRVAGRRIAEAPARLDVAWTAALAGWSPLVVGGRSAGARVACRTADGQGAAAVLCLAFPLVPPGRPDRSRLPELHEPVVRRLVVQGSRDGFGVPAESAGVQVHVVSGADHAMSVRRKDGRTAEQVLAEVADVVGRWLLEVRGQTLT